MQRELVSSSVGIDRSGKEQPGVAGCGSLRVFALRGGHDENVAVPSPCQRRGEPRCGAQESHRQRGVSRVNRAPSWTRQRGRTKRKDEKASPALMRVGG